MSSAAPIQFSAFTERRKLLQLWLYVGVASVALFVCLLVLSYFVYNAPSVARDPHTYRDAEATIGLGELLSLLITAVAVLRYHALRSKYRQRVFKRFIADNDWTPAGEFRPDSVASVLLGVGGPYETNYAFTGRRGRRTFTGLMFEFDDAVHKYSRTRRFVCLHVRLPKAFPMIVLDNRTNDYLRGVDSDLPERIPGGVVVDLEGDFSDYYRVTTTKGYERELVQVLSPDLMAVLADVANNKVDIEINARDMFLVYEADFYSEQNITALFTVADALLAKFDRSSKTWQASSKAMERAVEQSALAARRTLVYKFDFAGIVVSSAALVAFVVALLTDGH